MNENARISNAFKILAFSFIHSFNALQCIWLEENIYVVLLYPYPSSQKRILVECPFNN